MSLVGTVRVRCPACGIERDQAGVEGAIVTIVGRTEDKIRAARSVAVTA
jgi:hypothetical protein